MQIECYGAFECLTFGMIIKYHTPNVALRNVIGQTIRMIDSFGTFSLHTIPLALETHIIITIKRFNNIDSPIYEHAYMYIYSPFKE